MNKIRRALPLAFLVVIAIALSPVRAQTSAHATAAAADPLALLPASDAVLVIDPSRIWNEAIPRFFGNNRAPLADVIAQLDAVKVKSGIDPRSISRIAVGVRFVNPETVTINKVEKKDIAFVLIAQGDFDATKFLDFARSEAKGRGREETYGGQTVHYLDEGLMNGRERLDTERPAFVILDANTIAIGDLVNVRATVDAKNGNGQLNPELSALVMRNSNALISLAGNVPPQLAASIMPKEKAGESEMDKMFGKFFAAVASIRQLHLSWGLTPVGVEALVGARFSSTEQAQSLGDMLLGARQQYSVFIEDKTVRDSVTNMQITAQGDKVELRSEIPQSVITAMIEKASREKQKTIATAPPATTATKASQPVKQTPKRTRRSTHRKRH